MDWQNPFRTFAIIMQKTILVLIKYEPAFKRSKTRLYPFLWRTTPPFVPRCSRSNGWTTPIAFLHRRRRTECGQCAGFMGFCRLNTSLLCLITVYRHKLSTTCKKEALILRPSTLVATVSPVLFNHRAGYKHKALVYDRAGSSFPP